MDFYAIAFYLFALIVVVSGLGVVISRKLMYSAFSLLFTFFGVAGLYVLLFADFIAITQIMVYIGGILVLIIFGVMLTTKLTGVEIKQGITGNFQFGLAGVVSLAIIALLSGMFLKGNWILKEMPEVNGTIESLGNLLLTDYILAFEVAAVLLLIAFIGAAMIARKK
jgi:NADH-quinone oxidoreductase subunit J